jgi:putative FmdB family regulatory protein
MPHHWHSDTSSANRLHDPEGTVPTYQYACTACGHQLEAVQSFTDEPLTECPSCQGQLRKVFNSVGIVFKGSGFYRTDSRSGGGSDTATAGKTGGRSESGTGSSTNGSGDSGSSSSSASSSSNGDSGGATAAKPAAASSAGTS